jgi:hypothetical protein
MLAPDPQERLPALKSIDSIELLARRDVRAVAR